MMIIWWLASLGKSPRGLPSSAIKRALRNGEKWQKGQISKKFFTRHLAPCDNLLVKGIFDAPMTPKIAEFAGSVKRIISTKLVALLS